MRVPLGPVVREWGRIGLIGFGGPPAHVALLRELTVERRGWIEAREFEDANAACQLLPGPGSTQMAIYTAQRVAGLPGAFAGGLAFILPGLLIVLAIAAVALGEAPPAWIVGVGAGAGAAAIAVVAQAGLALGRSSLAGRRDVRAPLYLAAGFAAVVLAGALVVLVLARRRAARARLAPARPRRAARLAGRPRPGRDAHGPRLDRVQGRRAVVRRRLRDHPADAGGRGRPARLDDRGGVPQRGRLRPAHAGPGHAHGRAGRLGRVRPRRGAARQRDRVRAVVPRGRPRRRAVRRGCAATRTPARSSTAPARPRSARSSAPRSRWWPRSPSGGRARCSPPPRWCSLLGRAPLWALAGGALAGLAVALAGGPLP